MNQFLYTIVLLLGLAFFSCVQQKPNSHNSNADTTVDQFFDWYINGIYPETQGSYLLVSYEKQGHKKYIFNEQEYQEKITSIPFFTRSLKDSLIGNIRKCNAKMLKYDWDYEPEPQFNIDECSYLWYDSWIGGQGEDINGYTIDHVKSDHTSSWFKVTTLINDAPFSIVRVSVVKVQNDYKINHLQLDL